MDRRHVRTWATTARNGAVALTVTVAGVGASLAIGSPAQAATTSICAVGSIPAGWVATLGRSNDPSCGYLNRWQITNEIYPGMSMCAASNVPDGWYVSQVLANDPNCAYLNRFTIYPY
ncbi:hypothetical protein [Micromonospora sp. NPDC049240]|uniref:hypothetical protein n=1 Tax=Micromonospora sp. NPDC049240 TaxID=3155151 RepID=UPI0033D35297